MIFLGGKSSPCVAVARKITRVKQNTGAEQTGQGGVQQLREGTSSSKGGR